MATGLPTEAGEYDAVLKRLTDLEVLSVLPDSGERRRLLRKRSRLAKELQ
jgi:hypothetical protein